MLFCTPCRAIFALAIVIAPECQAQDPAASYPQKPIRLIVPLTAGGATDVLARVVGQGLTETFGQQAVVDNRPGASGNIGAELVAKAPPDGYTLLFGTTAIMAINPSLHQKLTFDTTKDLTPISMLVFSPITITAHPSLPVKTVRELISFSRARPAQLSYGSAGSGTPGHLIMETLKQYGKVDIVHVPYKGAAPALSDLLGGHIQLMTSGLPGVLMHMRAGKLRSLGLVSPQRSPLAPDIPTMIESGLPGVDDMRNWCGLFAPAGTPDSIIAKLSSTIARVLKTPSANERLSPQGYEPAGSSPEQLAEYLSAQKATWSKVVKQSKATAD